MGALIINMKKQNIAEFLHAHSTSKVLLIQKGKKRKENSGSTRNCESCANILKCIIQLPVKK